MRTKTDLAGAFALLEEQADEYVHSTGLQAIDRSRPRHRFVAAAAAAVVTVGVAAGAMTIYSATDRGPSAGSATNACVTSLPAAWHQAFRDEVEVPGSDAQPLAVSGAGALVTAWTDSDGNLGFGRVQPGLPLAPVGTIHTPTGTKIGTVASDGKDAVASFYRGARTRAVDLIDLKTGDVTPLLRHAPLAHHAHAFGGAWLTIQHRTVYWPASHAGSASPNVLVGYDIATRSYRHVQKPGPAVFYSPLGISWAGGNLASRALPPTHPAVGDPLAWSYYSDSSTVHWSDLEGHSRSVSQDLSHFLSVDAVAGPYVFLDRGEGDDADAMSGNVQILDTRTGAIADTHMQAAWYPVASRGGLLAFATGDPGSTFHLVDTEKLPQLRCD
jgi:hypothetical protein